MDKIKKTRTAVRSSYSRMVTNIKDLLGQSKIDMVEVKATFDTFENKYLELKKLDEQMFTGLLEANCSEADLDLEIESRDKYEQEFNRVRRRIESEEKAVNEKFSADNSNTEVSVAASQVTQRKFKLPQLELKKFGGNVKDWLLFWAQFKRLDEDVAIDDSDKFQYLVQSTIPGTRAREIVESYPPTAENYPKALDSLRARFGREELLVEVYVRELLALVMQNTMKTTVLTLASLYDKLECHLRALESLGVTTQKCASMLFPLVESCLPEELLRAWQRTNGAMNIGSSSQLEEQEGDSARNKLKQLMNFMRSEVENEEKISLAMSGFGISTSRYSKKKINIKESTGETSTAAGLLATNSKPEARVSSCMFCNNNHKTTDCFKAQKLTFAEKKQILYDKKCCYNCFRQGHSAKVCKLRIKCLICSRNHQPLMCPDLSQNKEPKDKSADATNTTENNLASISNNPQVFLQTIIVHLIGQGTQRRARAIIDTGSQRSYILSKSALEMKYEPIRKEKIIHTLFGGQKTGELNHNVYRIRLSSLQRDYNCNFEVLEQTTICNEINNIKSGPWLEELQGSQIYISDVEDGSSPIEILIGADVAGKLFTGNQKKLSSGLVAIETLLGWTVMGKIQDSGKNHQLAMTVTSMLVQEYSIADLWQLEAIGIKDPAETKSQAEIHEATNKHFHDTVTVRSDGRYEVCLPWIQDHPSLPDNYELAMKRLDNTIKKLKADNLVEEYQNTFNDWLKEEIIQECTDLEPHGGHYLPHRHVVKLNSTTKVRPVFDASAKQKGKPSLNECLDTGINLIEQIPIILLRFRLKRIGVIADIKKAFLQIGLIENDRNYLKFLWKGSDGILKVYKHCRVVFGVSCSPFLLGAVIQFHLNNALESPGMERNVIELLKDSFYVDNCVTSVNNEEELYKFKEKATSIMRNAKFDLRGWEFTNQVISPGHEVCSNVLGLQWDRQEDTLQINLAQIRISESDQITKRIILATANKVFDPIGYTCPVSLCPKLLLQETWKMKTSWDEEVDQEMKKKFIHWLQDLPYLEKIKLPRWFPNTEEPRQWSLHVFCDASQLAYATVIYLRSEAANNVKVELLQARTRVAPLKKITIPRLELLAATIGARLCATIVEEFKRQGIAIKTTFWSDSTTVLAWIRREENWGTFVRNRVEEIKRLTTEPDWRHVPGSENPADLPSRGCSAKILYESKWWEGPEWLYEPEQHWPVTDFSYNENEIREEKKKAIVSSMLIAENRNDGWYYRYFSRYTKIVYMIARILRWRKSKQKNEPITSVEFEIAEQKVIKLIQEEVFMVENYKKITFLSPFMDENGILRIRTKIAYRNDTRNFRYPILLTGDHVVVRRMIYDEHVKQCHVGTQTLLSILRERYWILRGRKAIRSVINKCVICQRYAKKHFETIPVPLPVDRVKDAAAFEVTGTDLAGPLYLKKEKKVWICIFTCASYRAVHLELVSSLSTEAFLMALRRFVARRGRPSIVYSDNGTNFHGAENSFEQLNWEEIRKYTTIARMEWKFNPPTAAWWGGWWERLIGIIKKLLKKVLGRSILNYEELGTVLCDCESIINSRPITYVSEDNKDLQPLTPSMFIQDIRQFSVEDCDEIESRDVRQRVVYRQKLREDLRKRFRSEYLGLLRQESSKKCSRKIELGEVVMIENDSPKRLDWPLAKVVELMPGRDDEIRVVRLKTSHGELVRPVQRIYPLELYSHNDSEVKNEGLSSDVKNNGLSSEVQTNGLSSDENCKKDRARKNTEIATIYTKKGRKITLPARYKM